MTSFAFILGLYPLVVANGASELARRGVGTPVFRGMILRPSGNLRNTAALRDFQGIRERLRPGARPHVAAHPADVGAPTSEIPVSATATAE
jgi:hypothetical protein